MAQNLGPRFVRACAVEMHVHMSQETSEEPLLHKFTGNMPQTKMSPERKRTLCASLRSRNACQDFTRATLYGNLQVKCRRPE